MMRTLGGDLVGMTGFPEVALAVEAGLPYASIGLVSNVAAGMADEPLSVEDIVGLIESAADPLYRLIGRTVELSVEGSA
jgi:5'-methylthioadenosine phosphorylase